MSRIAQLKQTLERKPEHITLIETKKIKKISNPTFRAELEAGYRERDINIKILTTILNSLFTHERATFLINHQTLSELIRTDRNLKLKEVGHSEFTDFFEWAIENEIFLKLKSGEKSSVGKDLYKLTDTHFRPLLSELIPEDRLKEQEKNAIGIFESHRNRTNMSEITPETNTPMEENSGGKNKNKEYKKNAKANSKTGTRKKSEILEEKGATAEKTPEDEISASGSSERKYAGNVDTSEEISKPDFPPDLVETEEMPEELLHIMKITDSWHSEQKAEDANFQRNLRNTKSRITIIDSYIEKLIQNKVSMDESELIIEGFKNGMLISWLKEDTDQNVILKEEIIADIDRAVFKKKSDIELSKENQSKKTEKKDLDDICPDIDSL